PTSSPTAPTPWSATPTWPETCARSTSTTSPPNNENRSASHHPAPDRAPHDHGRTIPGDAGRRPARALRRAGGARVVRRGRGGQARGPAGAGHRRGTHELRR